MHIDAPATCEGSNPSPGQAREHYARAMQAQREGDWALYGEEIRKLREVIRKMQP
jgi:uncharacterized membrane protein (UPF0182 family)